MGDTTTRAEGGVASATSAHGAAGGKEARITVRDLTMAFGSFVLMHDLNFTVNRSDIFIIMGGSGCGRARCCGI